MGERCCTQGRHDKYNQNINPKAEGKMSLEDLGVDGSITPKWILIKRG
jgi:hypothetical protein